MNDDDFRIYSPEASDNTADWPSKLYWSAVVLLLCAVGMFAVGKVAMNFGAAPWWSVL